MYVWQYPEITISMRYMAAKIQRLKTFFTSPPQKKWPLTYEDLLSIAEKIRKEPRDRSYSRAPKKFFEIKDGKENQV